MSKKEKIKCAKKCSIGGQALMEGIMMRGPEKSAMAVRRPNGAIFFEEKKNDSKKRPAICRWPVIRGVFGFVDSMITGYKCLMRSAEISMEESEEETTAEIAVKPPETVSKKQENTSESMTEKKSADTKEKADEKQKPKTLLQVSLNIR